jgi:CDP-paratose 2-epimerase
MSRILITGGCGHIGTNICIEAIKRGHSVVVMDNLHREEVVNNLKYLQEEDDKHQFSFVWGDVRNSGDFERIPLVDAVIHLAANPGIPWSIQWPKYDFETNAGGTVNALEFARKCGNAPFVYASTNKTFSDIINNIPTKEFEKRYVWTENILKHEKHEKCFLDFEDGKIGINENFPVQGFGTYGHSMYGISKLTGELYATEYHVQYKLPVVINKMSCIFGLFQKGAEDQGWISHFLMKIGFGDRKINIFGNGKQVRDVLDARDVARLYIDEVEDLSGQKKSNGKVFTVGGGPENTVSLLEAIEKIEEMTAKKAIITYFSKRSADQDIYISSLKTVKEIMGWEPKIKFEETIENMMREEEIDQGIL